MRKLRIGLLALITAGLLAGCGAMPASAPPVGSTTSVPVQTVVHSTPLSLQRFLSIPNKSVLITGYSITEAPPKSVVVVTRLQAQADYYRQFPSRVAPRILGIFLVRATLVRHTTATYPPAPNAILLLGRRDLREGREDLQGRWLLPWWDPMDGDPPERRLWYFSDRIHWCVEGAVAANLLRSDPAAGSGAPDWLARATWICPVDCVEVPRLGGIRTRSG